MSESDDCLFCKIIAGQIPSSKVYEDETTYASTTSIPRPRSTCSWCPRSTTPTSPNLPPVTRPSLAHIVSIAQNIADKEFHGAYRLVFNTGLDAGQTVFHVHAHVMTGEKLDE